MDSDSLHEARRFLKRVLGKIRPTFADYFNVPVRFKDSDWFVNERLVELPFIFQQIADAKPGARILEFGCSRSTLALSLASLGYEVTGVDLRPYPWAHARLTIYRGNLVEFEDDEGFDVITCVSVLEHVGLGAYGEGQDEEALSSVISKLVLLLKSDGLLLITVPVGRSHKDQFLRSFAPADFKSLFALKNLQLVNENYFCRRTLREWSPCSAEDVAKQDNRRAVSGPTGVNGVGCFAWKKQSG